MLVVKIQYVHQDAKQPKQATVGAAGWDVYAVDSGTVRGHSQVRIPLGFCLELPDGWQAKIKQRSSMFQIGLITNDSPIDSDYRGELFALVNNTSDWTWRFERGERIGQLLFEPVPIVRFVQVEELSVTARGAGGWGSTGK